jgi:DNA-binding NtrC family response regulator
MVVHALVVDDDEFVRGAVVRQLRVAGATSIAVAKDWSAARVALDTFPECNVVVSDLDMPGAAGSAFIDELASVRPGIGLIIASALEPLVLQTIERHARSLPLRLLGCVPKPTSADLFRDLLKPLHGG